MNDNIKDVAAQFGSIALATGLACLSQVVNSKMVEAVFGNIAANLASGYIDRLEYRKFQRAFLRSPHPTLLNHDLQKLVMKALDWTIQNLGTLYAEQLSTKQERKESAAMVALMRKRIASNFKLLKVDNEEVMQMIGRPFDADVVIDRWKVLQTDERRDPVPQAFEEFVRSHFAEQLQLCLGELLKQPENNAALIAYNKQLHNAILQGIEDLKLQNEQLLVRISKPLEEPKGSSHYITPDDINAWFGKGNEAMAENVVRAALDSWTVELKARLDVIIEEIKRSRADIANIRVTAEEFLILGRGFDSALRENWIHKHRVIVLFGSAAVLVALVVWSIWKSQAPFTMSLSLHRPADLALALDYPAFTFPMEITIITERGSISKKATSATDIIFRDLPAELRGAAVGIRVDGMYWESRLDTLVIAEGDHAIELVPDEELAKVMGILRNAKGLAPLPHATVQVSTDTVVQTDMHGTFQVELPYHMRRPLHLLTVTAPDGSSITEEYRPRSGPIELWLGR
ncbi:MAG TPA: hypothetical protein PLB89_13875 [Flavobacteriales bacterium]|nr:hypothetical protein [Flavobacteriales bacterium]